MHNDFFVYSRCMFAMNHNNKIIIINYLTSFDIVGVMFAIKFLLNRQNADNNKQISPTATHKHMQNKYIKCDDDEMRRKDETKEEE